MKRPTLALPQATWDQLVAALETTQETAGVLAATPIDDMDGTTILGRQLSWATPNAYMERRADGLALRSSGWLPAVRAAGKDKSMALFVHTHPRGSPEFSRHDDGVDDALAPEVMTHTGVALYGSIVVAGTVEAPTVAARFRRGDGTVRTIDVIRVVGSGLKVRLFGGDEPDDPGFDRQVRAFGADGQRVIRSLRVGLVGAGGTGSAVAEQLIRLGVGEIVAVDDDMVTGTSVSRGYGSSIRDVGRPKVEVLASLAERIGLGTVVIPVQGNLRTARVAKALRHCDVVFSCVDGHGARLVLNRFASWQLAPVVDLAVLISSIDGRVMGIDGRVTWLAPGTACLLCRGRIDPTLAYAEQLDPEERRALAQQGYAPGLDEPEPSVVSHTTLIAALGTSELLARLFGLASAEPTEVLLQAGERHLRSNRRPSRPGCFCMDPATWGAGTREPYLDLIWAG